MVMLDGNAVFGSGPCRVMEGPRGEYVLTKARVSPFQAGSEAIGPLEVRLIVTGRLVAGVAADLNTLVQSITDLLADPPNVYTVSDELGREWSDMAFVLFEPTGPVESGREVSMAYRAELLRFLVP